MLISAAQAQDTLALEKTIPLPGVSGRIDHLSADVAGRRLFVAALGNNTVEALDLAAGSRIRSLPGFQEPQGLVYIPDLGKLFVADGGDGAVRILGGKSLQVANTVGFADDADNVRYDPAEKQLYVGYGKGALGVVDALGGKRLADVKLDGHPESFQLEKAGSRIFVNVPTAGHIAVIDRRKRSVIAKWPVTQAGANFPMALDEPGRRLFIGCRKPAKVVVFDTATGQASAEFACVGDTDDLFYDAARKRLYISGGEGFISVFDLRDAGRYQQVAKIATAAGARTSLFVPDLDRLYLAVPRRGSQGSEIRVYQPR